MQGLPRAVYCRKWGALHVADPVAQPPAHSSLRLENAGNGANTRSVVVKETQHHLEKSSGPEDETLDHMRHEKIQEGVDFLVCCEGCSG